MFFRLLATQLRQRYGLSVFKHNIRKDKKALLKQVGVIAAVVYGIGAMLVIYCILMNGIFKAAKLIGRPEVVLIYALLAAMVVVLFFGTILILGTLFFTKDGEFLASLPIPQKTVFAAKLAMVYVSELWPAVLFAAPPAVIYGIGTSAGALFYLKALIVVLFIPAIPLALSSLVALPLMSLVGRTKRRDTIAVIAGFAFIIAIFVAQNLFISGINENSFDFKAILGSQEGFINLVGRVFPPSAWASLALAKAGLASLWYLFGYIGLSVLLFLVLLPVASKIYYSGMLSQFETAKKGRKSRSARPAGAGSPIAAMFYKELKTVMRSPVYALNSFAGILMGFIIMMLPAFGGNIAEDPDIQTLTAFLTQKDNMFVIMLGFAGLLAFIGAINPAAGTMISREGRAFWLLKTLPVSYERQIKGKFLFGYIIAALSVAATVIGAAIGIRLPPAILVGSAALALAAAVPLTAISVFADLFHPKLSWNNETEAIKQNMSVITAMLGGMIFVAILAGITVLLFFLGTPGWAVFAATLALSAGTGFALYAAMLRFAAKKLASMED